MNYKVNLRGNVKTVFDTVDADLFYSNDGCIIFYKRIPGMDDVPVALYRKEDLYRITVIEDDINEQRTEKLKRIFEENDNWFKKLIKKYLKN